MRTTARFGRRLMSGASTVALMALFPALLSSSCKYLAMEPLEVVRVAPDSDVVDFSSLTAVEVVFSADVERPLAERAFNLREDGVEMQGSFSWPSSDRFSFTPVSAFKNGSTYTISVTTQAEDVDGNSLEDDFTREFRSSSDRVRPTVTAMAPIANTSIASVRPAITVSFSEPMNVTSVIDAFDIVPSADGFFRESADGKTFEFVLTEDLDWQTRYEAEIGETASDLAGNTLGKATKASFFTGLESVSPTVLSATDTDSSLTLAQDNPLDSVETVTDGINAKDRITIRFSEPMDEDSVKNAISFLPTARYETSWNSDGTEITLTPDPSYDHGKFLCLAVAKSARDASGNEMAETATFKFRVTGSRSRPPVVVGVDFLNGFDGTGTPLATGLVTLTPMASIAFAEHYMPASEPATKPIGFFDVHFELAEGATVNLVDFLSKFSVTCDGASIMPFAAELDSNITHMATVPHDRGLPASPTRHVVRYFAYVNNWSAAYKHVPGLMKLTLSADFSDSLGNGIASAWSLTVNTTN